MSVSININAVSEKPLYEMPNLSVMILDDDNIKHEINFPFSIDTIKDEKDVDTLVLSLSEVISDIFKTYLVKG